MVSLSIVIVAYNAKDLVRNCLHSIEQTGRDLSYEMICIDNCSTDGCREMLRSKSGQYTVVLNDQNAGFSRASNQGIRLARGEFLLLLNGDTIVLPGALDAMVDFLREHPDAGAVSCRLLNADGSPQASVSTRTTPWMVFCRLFGLARLAGSLRVRQWLATGFQPVLGKTIRGYLIPYHAFDTALEVENLSGACLLFRRQVTETVGLLDENFFMYLEDMDFCLRIRKAGWKIWYLPSASIIHLVGQSSGGMFRNFDRRSFESLLYYYRKHHGLPTVLLIRGIVLGYCFVQSAYLFLARLFWWEAGVSDRKSRSKQLREIFALAIAGATENATEQIGVPAPAMGANGREREVR